MFKIRQSTLTERNLTSFQTNRPKHLCSGSYIIFVSLYSTSNTGEGVYFYMFITKSKIDWYLINTKSPINKEYPVSLPQKFTKITNWRVKLKTIPRCPNSTLIYLIKTSRYNFELRRLSRIILPKNKALFVIGLNSETGKLFVVKNQCLTSILENISDEKKLKKEISGINQNLQNPKARILGQKLISRRIISGTSYSAQRAYVRCRQNLSGNIQFPKKPRLGQDPQPSVTAITRYHSQSPLLRLFGFLKGGGLRGFSKI